MQRPVRATRWTAAAAGLAAGAYAAHALWAWARYGRPARRGGTTDALLDAFMPAYDVAERHQIHVDAPADLTLLAASRLELFQLPIVRAVVKGRELFLGASPDARPRPPGLLAEALALGWAVLAERPGREIVVGAATRPWEPDVTFRPVPPESFAAFDEPGYVKIAWTLGADPRHEGCVFRTETRAVATDAAARARFRRYWALLSPGIALIRMVSLRPVKAAAERAWRAREAPS